MRYRLSIALAAALLATQARPALAALCFFDSRFDGSGVPIKWLASPIKYYINASRLPAAQRAAAIAAVQAAFNTWEISCTTLTFKYEGPSTAFEVIDGAINVYWGDDAATWTHGTSAYYWFFGGITSFTTGEMTRGYIGMNARDAQWTVGAETMKFDIQTTVTRMIPGTIGFFVGPDPNLGGVGVSTNQVDHGLSQEHLDGARATYFKADPGCTKPPQPIACDLWGQGPDSGPQPADAGPDAGTPADQAVPPSDQTGPPSDQTGPPSDQATTAPDQAGAADSSAADQGTVADRGAAPGDGGTGPIGGDGPTIAPVSGDSGCCSTSHARHADQGALFSLCALLLVALRLTRRRRRPSR